MKAAWRTLSAIDPSFWVLFAGVLLRIDVALRFNVAFGYDAPAHFRYTEILAGGDIPRVGMDTWATQHPPVFYALALMLEKLGLGHGGGKLISLLAGVARLFLADRLFLLLEQRGQLPRQVRLFANVIHAFVPVGIRMDVFYSPESLAATLCVLAVWLAVHQRAVPAGVVLGLALLSKATAVVTVPAVAIALIFRWKQALLALAIAGVMLFAWAYDNIQQFGTPYPNAYRVDPNPAWKKPVLERHHVSYYYPRLQYSELLVPFYKSPPLSMPNVLVIDTWGDYYNFLGHGPKHYTPLPDAANGNSLGRAKLTLHIVLAHLALPLTALMLAGFIGAVIRLARRQIAHEEVAFAVLGLGYVAIMIWYAIWVAYEHDGPAKSAYALGASTILSWWTGRAAAKVYANRWARYPLLLLLIAPVAIAVLLRVFW